MITLFKILTKLILLGMPLVFIYYHDWKSLFVFGVVYITTQVSVALLLSDKKIEL